MDVSWQMAIAVAPVSMVASALARAGGSLPVHGSERSVQCRDGYADGSHEGIGVATALHLQTLVAFRLSDDILPTCHGYPVQEQDSHQSRFQEPKICCACSVTNQRRRGYWTDWIYNWFSRI
jgi:DMSO/TMAO reductase YedYZ molybdopterin-dependent catalytic subunit